MKSTILKHRFKHYLRILDVKKQKYYGVLIVITLILTALIGYMLYEDTKLFNEFKLVDHVKNTYVSLEINENDDLLTHYKSKELQQALKHNNSTLIHEYFVSFEMSNYLNINNEPVSFKNFYVPPEFIGSPLLHQSNSNFIESLYLTQGRNFTEADIMSQSTYVIISESTKQRLFDNQKKVLGESITLNIYNQLIEFKIIGVVNDFSNQQSNMQQYGVAFPLEIFIPISWHDSLAASHHNIIETQYLLYETSNPNEIYNLVTSQSIFQAITSFGFIYRAMVYRNMLISQFASILGILSLISSIAIYSMFLVINGYRSEEIGIKRAIGASKRDIFQEFFIETFIIMMGCLLVSLLISTFMISIYVAIERRIVADYVLHIRFESILLLVGYIITTIISMSLLLAHRATKVEIVDSIRDL